MHRNLGVSVLLLTCLATGCSDPTKGEVSGTITVHGKPANGSIGFIPVDGRGQTTGAKIVDGKYTATVSVGNMRVEIHVPVKVGEKRLYEADPNSDVTPLMEESLPAKYNEESELTFEVKTGKSEKNYELEAKKVFKRFFK